MHIGHNNRKPRPGRRIPGRKGEEEMTNEEAIKMIGERAAILAENPEIQQKMIEIAKQHGKETAESWCYKMAICTLAGI